MLEYITKASNKSNHVVCEYSCYQMNELQLKTYRKVELVTWKISIVNKARLVISIF